MSNGIPTLLNKVGQVQGTITLLAADAAAVLGLNRNQVWGIYYLGEPVIVADSVVSFDYRQDWRIVEYPLEAGAFASYNKVQEPFAAKVTLTRGGSDFDRQEFLAQIDAAANSLNLYDVITPERTYASMNIHHYDTRRTAHHGKTLLSVDIWLMEIRITAAIAFSNTKAPSGAGTVSVGVVQPVAASETAVATIPSMQ